MNYSEQHFLVRPQIGLLNKYARKAKQVAFTSVSPVFSGSEAESQRKELQALRIQVEGPTQHISRFGRLVEAAGLNFKA